MIPHLYWIAVESALSILAVCLPAIFQLSRRGHQLGPGALFRSNKRQRARQGSRDYLSGSNESNKKNRVFHQIWRDDSVAEDGYTAGVISLRDIDEDIVLPLERIVVRQDINVQYT